MREGPNAGRAPLGVLNAHRTVFDWNGDRLTSIDTSSQDPTEKPWHVYFDYGKDGGMVRRVTAEDPKDDTKKDNMKEGPSQS